MGPIQEIDRAGQILFFFLTEFVHALVDSGRSTEDREGRREHLDALMISGGPPMLLALQRAFAFSDLASDPLPVEWLIDFAAPLEPQWVNAVDLNLIVRYWKVAPNRRARNKAAELISRYEFLQPNSLVTASLSRLAQLFRQFEGNPLEAPLSTEANQIVDVLVARAALTPASMLNESSLGRYGLYVLRYCFVEPGTRIRSELADRLLPIASGLTLDRQEIFRNILLTTL